MLVRGQIVDIEGRRIYPGEILIRNGHIESITESDSDHPEYIMPGFIDAHIHIESSMLVPSEFARIAVMHGTVATISDPHEIANVLGIDGVRFMIDNGKKVPFKFHFGAPSCVPATSFETAGAAIDSEGVRELLASPDIYYLAEMMNYPGVLGSDPEVIKKIEWARHYNKPADGHAPGLRGNDAQAYAAAGLTTDHECFTYEEALEKLGYGMKILIREGSAAKNFEALIPLLEEHFQNMMFCSDDKHPDDLIAGHINELAARAVEKGCDVFKVLRAACINPIEHYSMSVGRLRVGDPADFIVVQDLVDFKVLQTYINGECVAKDQQSQISPAVFDKPNSFNIAHVDPADFKVIGNTENIRVIEAMEGQLVTNEVRHKAKVTNGFIEADISNDILKIAVVNRYSQVKPAVAFIKNFGLKRGAIASSVAHDCHNIVVVGTSDEEICAAVNLLIDNKGGICAVDRGRKVSLALPVAGIISDLDGWETARLYQEADAMAKELGSQLKSPFMTLSFMALLVIPDLKLSDKGLFSGKTFSFVTVPVA